MKCQFINNFTGKACRSQARADSKFCLWHDPERKEEALKARQEGAKQSRLSRERSAIRKLNSIKDLCLYHKELIEDFAEGKIADKKFEILSGALAKQRELMGDKYIEDDRRLHKHSVGITGISRVKVNLQDETDDISSE